MYKSTITFHPVTQDVDLKTLLADFIVALTRRRLDVGPGELADALETAERAARAAYEEAAK